MPAKLINPEKIFDELKLKIDDKEVRLLTDPGVVRSGVQDIFVKELKKRFMDENWDFLRDIKNFFAKHTVLDGAAKQELKELSKTYFKTSGSKTINVDADLRSSLESKADVGNLTLNDRDLQTALGITIEQLILKNIDKTAVAATIVQSRPQAQETNEKICTQIAIVKTIDALDVELKALRDKLADVKTKNLEMTPKKGFATRVSEYVRGNPAENYLEYSIKKIEQLKNSLATLASTADNKTSASLGKEFDTAISQFKKMQADNLAALRKYENQTPGLAQRNGNPSDQIIKVLKAVEKNGTRARVTENELSEAKENKVLSTKQPGVMIVLSDNQQPQTKKALSMRK